MKKVVAVLLAFIFLVSVAVAESIDLSGMSFDELVELVNRAQREMMKSDIWQEVEVPAGTYLIGKDIPAGHWTIRPTSKKEINLEWGTAVKEDGVSIDIYSSSFWNHATIIAEDYVFYDEGDQTFVSWELKDGQYIEITNGNVIFSPYQGNSFSFK